jgi:hypothetical protein
MNNDNIPELKRNIWLLVEAVSALSGKSKVSIVREFTTSQSFPNGKTFNELTSKWNLCKLRGKIDDQFVKLGYSIHEWYRTGNIEKIAEPKPSTYIPVSVGEGTPPKLANGSYDTKRT